MSLSIFQSSNKRTLSENQFYNFLIEKFSNTEMDISLFFDINLGGTQFDCLIVSSKGLLVVEYKNYSGKLSASHNGRWFIENHKGESIEINKDRETPYEQIRNQRFKIMNFLNDNNQENLNKIFIDKRSDRIKPYHISFFLCFENLTKESDLQLGKESEKWFKNVSKDSIIIEFDKLRTSQLTFTIDEIHRFANLLELKQKTTENINDQKDYCFVCDYSTEKCNKKFVNGKVIDIKQSIITIKSSNNQFLIEYKKTDLSELQLIKEFYFNVYRKIGTDLEINFFHLNKDENFHDTNNFIITDYSIIVIQPSWLINVTDFTSLGFCERQSITKQFSKNPVNVNVLRGSVVNDTLTDLIKSEKDTLGKNEKIDNASSSVENYLQRNLVSYEVSGASTDDSFKEKIKTEIKNIADWTEDRTFNGDPEFEEFIISPKLGLKGKLDVVFKKDKKITDIVELKSSKKDWKTNGIHSYHELQVVAYSMMVMLKQNKKLDHSDPSVIYSQSTDGIEANATLNYETFSRVSKFRNILLNASLSLKLPTEIDVHPQIYQKGCWACSDIHICKNICVIKEPESICNPTCFKHPDTAAHRDGTRLMNKKGESILPCNLHSSIIQSKRDKFEFWYDFLNRIKIYHYQKYNKLMKENINERKNKGKLIEGDFHCDRKIFDKWKYNIDLSEKNGSEFRSKDLVLIMEKENYDDGESKVGEILSITNNQCQILVNEKFDFNPKFITTYYNDSNDKINNIGLYNAFFDRTKIYDIFYNDVNDSYSELIEELNIELILGPPGSGKTTTICNNIITSLKNGETIFVMCFTNRALDEVLDKLKNNDYFRDNNINDVIYRFNRRAYDENETKEVIPNNIKVFLSTVHGTRSEIVNKWKKEFDVCYIDEASQLNFTMCANGFLGKKNILVGDYNQLAPLIPLELPTEFDIDEIKKSFFEILWEKFQKSGNQDRCKPLQKQYRMNKEISSYPFSKWYKSIDIENDESIENRKLEYENNDWENDVFKKILDPDNPTLWIQVDNDDDNDNNRINLKEAKICSEIVNKFFEYGKDNIGVIAPFRRQVNEIRNLIIDSNESEMPHDLVDTVDRYQGSQKEIIIISICAEERNNFLENDYRRLNVALTRPKFKRIIVGDFNKVGDNLKGILNDGYTKKININEKEKI
tara:strand:- start:458 stop:3934 length:3477 start_codon:yes stop_codon:yes gene_type:complete